MRCHAAVIASAHGQVAWIIRLRFRPGGGPGPARLRVYPGAAAVTPWAWLKFTIFLWLLRKTLKLTGWLLLAAAVIVAWPVTLVAAAAPRPP